MSAWTRNPPALSTPPTSSNMSAPVETTSSTTNHIVEYVDIGPNLTNAAFARDLEAVLVRSFSAGVRTLILTSVDPASWNANLAIIQRFAGRRDFPRLKMTCGVHPNWSQHFRSDTLTRMRSFVNLHREHVVAIGECGLDYFRHPETREQQLRVLEEQLQLSIEIKLPLFLHDRDSSGDMGMLLSKYALLGARFVVHCFSGTSEEMHKYIALGGYIGITGFIAMQKRGAGLRSFIGSMPQDRLLIETDSPYCCPDGAELHGAQSKTRRNSNHKDVRNEPCYLPLIVPTLAACFQVSDARIAQMSTANARRLFAM